MVWPVPIRRDRASAQRSRGRCPAGHDPVGLRHRARGRRSVLCATSGDVFARRADHDLRPVLTRPGRGHEADGAGGHLPRRVGHLGKGIVCRGPRSGPCELPPQPGSRRSCRLGARAPHRRQEPAFRALPDGRGDASIDAGDRLPAVHHRRRRHRPWRRRACAEPDPSIRRGGRSRLSHRGPEARRQEMRTSERQGPGRPGRTEQAAQCRAPATRHHAGAGHHRRADRCRGSHVHRQLHRRARPAFHPRGDEPGGAELPRRFPGNPEVTPRPWAGGHPGPPPVRRARGRVAAGACLAWAGRAHVAHRAWRWECSRQRRWDRDRVTAGHDRHPVLGHLAGGGWPQDLRRGGCRNP